MSSSGTDIKKLFEYKSSCRNPSVSVDGKRIAFLCVERSGQKSSSYLKLLITNNDGKILREIDMQLSYSKPSWSINGFDIAVADEQNTIYSVNYLTGVANKITKGFTPAFSHDGKYLAFIRHRKDSGRSDLVLLNLVTKNEKILVANDNFGQGPHSSPQWTSDGKYILYAHYVKSMGPVEKQELMAYSIDLNSSILLFKADIAISGFSLKDK